MDGGDNEQFESAFETGVMSTGRPGDGTKFTGNIDKIRGTKSRLVAFCVLCLLIYLLLVLLVFSNTRCRNYNNCI